MKFNLEPRPRAALGSEFKSVSVFTRGKITFLVTSKGQHSAQNLNVASNKVMQCVLHYFIIAFIIKHLCIIIF